MLLLPETPRMWIKRGQPEKAAQSLSMLRRLDINDPSLVEELAEITANHEYELSLGEATYLDCFKGNLGKRLATGCGLQALQQLTGVNFIFYYGTSFFKNSGITSKFLFPPPPPPFDLPLQIILTSSLDSFVVSMITCGVNVTSTLPGLWMVEKWGRRNLLLFGAVGMAVSQFIVAGVGTGAGIENLAAQKALIAFVCIYIFFFACSWGPVAWIVTGESKSSFYIFRHFGREKNERLTLLLITVFPLKVRAKSLSMTTGTFPPPPPPFPPQTNLSQPPQHPTGSSTGP